MYLRDQRSLVTDYEDDEKLDFSEVKLKFHEREELKLDLLDEPFEPIEYAHDADDALA